MKNFLPMCPSFLVIILSLIKIMKLTASNPTLTMVQKSVIIKSNEQDEANYLPL